MKCQFSVVIRPHSDFQQQIAVDVCEWLCQRCWEDFERAGCVFLRSEAGYALGAHNHSVCVVPPFLWTCQPACVRALPGGHELCVPGRQSGGAAHQDPGHHQRKPQVVCSMERGCYLQCTVHCSMAAFKPHWQSTHTSSQQTVSYGKDGSLEPLTWGHSRFQMLNVTWKLKVFVSTFWTLLSPVRMFH